MKKVLISFVMSLFLYATLSAADTRFNSVATKDGEPAMVTLLDVPVASTTTILGVNGVSITTATLVSGGTTFVKGASGTSNQFTQITYPRNVQIVAYIDGATFTTLSGKCLITGKNSKGKSVTETVAITTNAVDSSNAWATIDSFAFSGFTINSTSSTVNLHIGTSNKIGIAGDIRAVADVYKIVNAGVDKSTSTHAVSIRYNTVDLSAIGGLVPDGSLDYILMYLKKKIYFE